MSIKNYYFVDTSVGLLFSGDRHDGRIACPWILLEDNQTILGINHNFRDFFHADLSSDVSNYSEITNFTIRFTNVYHEFKLDAQGDTGQSGFDPYYGLLVFYIGERTVSNLEKWVKIQPDIENILSGKWYFDRVKFSTSVLPLTSASGLSSIGSILVLAIVSVISMKIRRNSSYH